MRFHWGKPKHPTKVRAHTGTLLNRLGGESTRRFTDHHISSWYGVSFRLHGFFGLIRFADTEYPSETQEKNATQKPHVA